MRAPLALLALTFAAGIGGGWGIRPPLPLLALATGAAAWFFRRSGRRAGPANAWLLALVFLAGAGRAEVDGCVPADSVRRLLTADSRPITCEGIVTGEEVWVPPAGGPVRRKAWLELTRIRQPDAWAPASGKVQLRLPARAKLLGAGDRLRLHGQIRAPLSTESGTAAAPGAGRRFDEEKWLWTQGACGVLAVSGAESLTVLPGRFSLWNRCRRRVAGFRWRLQELGRTLLGPGEAGFLEAFLLGEGRGIPAEVKEAFRRTGTIHILVVSGFQVGLIGGIALVALALLRIPRGPRYLLTALGLVLYCALTGAAPPILRATVMGVLLCLGRYQGREVSPLNLLGAAALAILVFDPRALADVGFQLSFAAVLGLLLAGAGWPKSGWIMQAAAASLGAWVAVTPLVAWHMRMINWTAPAVNLAVVPLGSALVAAGFLVYGIGLISPPAAVPFAACFGLLAGVMTRLVSWAAALPGGCFRW